MSKRRAGVLPLLALAGFDRFVVERGEQAPQGRTTVGQVALTDTPSMTADSSSVGHRRRRESVLVIHNRSRQLSGAGIDEPIPPPHRRHTTKEGAEVHTQPGSAAQPTRSS